MQQPIGFHGGYSLDPEPDIVCQASRARIRMPLSIVFIIRHRVTRLPLHLSKKVLSGHLCPSAHHKELRGSSMSLSSSYHGPYSERLNALLHKSLRGVYV